MTIDEARALYRHLLRDEAGNAWITQEDRAVAAMLRVAKRERARILNSIQLQFAADPAAADRRILDLLQEIARLP